MRHRDQQLPTQQLKCTHPVTASGGALNLTKMVLIDMLLDIMKKDKHKYKSVINWRTYRNAAINAVVCLLSPVARVANPNRVVHI